ncbi:hypothetical protein I4F81_010879 [Pyropia yezoensis]|uniref:Uncharacterized protein n=1 Tax=Pyropia yezoensis TaxID=2788 RepID=A0ACC3CE66_PYRYE|nr:hypothetical protein I4F81_010879 [Neopyropia yezoensis]
MHIGNVLAFTTPVRAAAMSILRFGVQMYFSSLSPRGGRPVASGNAYIRPLDSTSEEQYLVKFGASKACGSGGPVIVILFEDTLGVLADPAKYMPEIAGTPTPSPTRWGCGTPSGGSSKFGWVANTGQHHRRSWLEWFNILTLGALLSGIAWRLFAFIVIEEACSPYENFGAVAFGGYVAWMMAPVALVSLNERLSSADESGREGKPMPVPTPIIAAALTILGVVFLSGWANARCGIEARGWAWGGSEEKRVIWRKGEVTPCWSGCHCSVL